MDEAGLAKRSELRRRSFLGRLDHRSSAEQRILLLNLKRSGVLIGFDGSSPVRRLDERHWLLQIYGWSWVDGRL